LNEKEWEYRPNPTCESFSIAKSMTNLHMETHTLRNDDFGSFYMLYAYSVVLPKPPKKLGFSLSITMEIFECKKVYNINNFSALPFTMK